MHRAHRALCRVNHKTPLPRLILSQSVQAMMAETAALLHNAPEGSETVLQTTSLLQPEDQVDPNLNMNVGLDGEKMAGMEKNLEKIVNAIGRNLKAVCLPWEQVISESEQFEVFCPTRVDKLLQEASALEAHLLNQKEQLINRLRKLSQTLQVAP